MAVKQSSPEMSALASRVLGLKETEDVATRLPYLELLAAAKSLAGSVLSQDETPGQAVERSVVERVRGVIRLRERGDTSEYNTGFDAGLRAAETVVVQELENGPVPPAAANVTVPLQPDHLAMVSLLKGQYPAGVSAKDLKLAAGIPLHDEVSIDLIGGGWARRQEGQLFATDATVANPAIPAVLWPARKDA